jgi:hypothetical protein
MPDRKIRANRPGATRTTPGPRTAAHGARYNAQRPSITKCGPDCKQPTAAQAHCTAPGCHRTFGGVSNFDRHRDDGRCLNPAPLGMVERDGVWRTPMPEDVAERLRASREDARA